MPLYAYRCEACGAEEEHLQKFSDPPKAECESCGGALSKLLTPTAFHLKGGGWYKDGYASAKPDGASTSENKSDKGEAKADKATSKKDSGGTSSGGSSKAAAGE